MKPKWKIIVKDDIEVFDFDDHHEWTTTETHSENSLGYDHHHDYGQYDELIELYQMREKNPHDKHDDINFICKHRTVFTYLLDSGVEKLICEYKVFKRILLIINGVKIQINRDWEAHEGQEMKSFDEIGKNEVSTHFPLGNNFNEYLGYSNNVSKRQDVGTYIISNHNQFSEMLNYKID